MRKLFEDLYFAPTEDDVEKVISNRPEIFRLGNWCPLGGNENNFGVIENQQSNPIAALIEKITNSIDAVLMKKCLEAGIHPESKHAPRSMEKAKAIFFENHAHWDLSSYRKQQAENIQIIADGPKMNTSLIVYDDGEGQHPENFEKTFLSLLYGNKNKIHFVQGKYNMGGSGAVVFCGKKRYQLIGSKRYDNTGRFGFTLIREHPLSSEEEKVKKNTWYEYLKVDEDIPAFDAAQQDLGLYNRQFTTGTIIKLYSYDLPAGSRSVISRDLNQSINEYLFEPILPVITVDKKERYPDDRNLERDLYGLKRRLEQDDNKYVDGDPFSDEFDDALFGKMKVTCYVFKTKIDNRSAKETRETIRREFFKNRMSVLFSVNGQVHGHYTSEFITRSLKLNLLKEHLLIHVDCTNMNYNFRKELFMASRDRLKAGEETRELREFLAKKLGDRNGRLAEIQKLRKDSMTVEGGDAQELLKSLTQNLPMDSDLMKLLAQTLKLDNQTNGKPKKNRTKSENKREDTQPFNPKRFPSFFKRRGHGSDDRAVAVQIGGEKTVYFDTDVEDHYFNRIEEPGELKIALLDFKRNEAGGGNAPGQIDRIEDVFNVRKSSPQEGTIKIHLSPTEAATVGDALRIQASLSDPSGEYKSEAFWVKISEPETPKHDTKKKEETEIPNFGLPQLILVYQEPKDNALTWDVFEKNVNSMDYNTVMHPMVNGEKLEAIYINMDSTVLKNVKSKSRNPNEEQLELANRKYIAAVYFHTLFLYTITRNRKYGFTQAESEGEVDLEDYLKDLFESYYAEFILNFGTEEFMQSLAD